MRERYVGLMTRLSSMSDKLRSQSGQSMIEYGLILVLVSVVAIVILVTDGGNLKNVFQSVANSL